MSDFEQISILILKYWNGEKSSDEEAQLQDWINANPENAAMLKRFKSFDWVIQKLKRIENAPMERAKERLWGKSSLMN